MKIIAVTKYDFIVQMNGTELEALNAGSGSGCRINHRDLEVYVGREYAIHESWGRLRALADNRKKLESIAGQLKAMGELLEPIIPEVARLSGEKEPGQPQEL